MGVAILILSWLMIAKIRIATALCNLIKCFTCLFFFFSKQLQEELSFQTGQIINVYGEMDDDGFYLGEIDGQRGLVPSNFLAEVTDQYNQTNQQSGRGRGGRGHGPGARGPPPPPRDNRMPQQKRQGNRFK